MAGNVELVGGGAIARATIEATIIRADGTIEELGVIADSGLLRAPPRRGLLSRVKETLWPKH